MAHPATQKRVVVIGNGLVGQRFVDLLADQDLDRLWHVTVLGEEPRRAYDRVALSSYFEGKTAEDLDVVTPGVYDDASYVLTLNDAVVTIDRASRSVTTASGRRYAYDTLVRPPAASP